MLSAEEIDHVEALLVQLKASLKVDPSDPGKKYDLFNCLDASVLFGHYYDIHFYKSMDVIKSKREAKLLLAKVWYHIPSGKYSLGSAEVQLVGIKRLENNYGKIHIRPESLQDKVTELFVRTEIDFHKFPEFSSKYFLQSASEKSAIAFATVNRLELIERQKEMIIEVAGDVLIAKYSRMLNLEDMTDMYRFIEKI